MNEFKVGLLAIATIVAVVYMSLTVTSNQSGFGDYVGYQTLIKDASGIFPKTPIKIAGINAGRIRNIELRGNFALIEFEVLETIKIPSDSILRIKTVGFLGDKFIEIVVGTNSEPLAEMEFIVADEGAGMESLLADAGDVMKDVKKLVGTFREIFAPEDQVSPLKTMMTNLEEISTELNGAITDNKDRIGQIMDNVERLTHSLAEETDRNLRDSSLSKLHGVLETTQMMTKDLQLMIADVRAGKGTIGQFLVEDQIADEVKQTLASVNKIVSRVDSLRTEIAVFTGGNTEFGAETEAELRLHPSPERFYLLGITTSKFGPERETIYTTEQNGTTSSRTEKIQDKDSYRFNVQLGRRIHQWSFRGGLIQSTGGFGVDYELKSYAAKFSAEAYDYRKDIGINLRLMSEFQIWNVLYGKVALEDVAQDDRSATFSAGLRFTDEDIKGLVGFFL